MLLHIPDILTPEQVKIIRQRLIQADWLDGRQTAGHQSMKVKNNQQISEKDPLGKELGQFIIAQMVQNSLFTSAALPYKFYPPLFNKYEGGGEYGFHVDGAVRFNVDTGERVRTDVSGTLFLTNPDEYQGGELIIDDVYGQQSVKLPAGHLVLYPSTSIHKVMPVTQGARISCFFWLQSLVREDSQRSLLFELDQSIQELTLSVPDHPRIVSLSGIYHNLLRRWTQA